MSLFFDEKDSKNKCCVTRCIMVVQKIRVDCRKFWLLEANGFTQAMQLKFNWKFPVIFDHSSRFVSRNIFFSYRLFDFRINSCIFFFLFTSSYLLLLLLMLLCCCCHSLNSSIFLNVYSLGPFPTFLQLRRHFAIVSWSLMQNSYFCTNSSTVLWTSKKYTYESNIVR